VTAPFASVPGTARTVVLFATAATARADRPLAALPLRWPDHQVDALLDYTLDATGLQASAADTLTVTAVAAEGIVVLATIVSGGRVVLWLGGATAAIGADATIDLTIQTAGGRRVHRIIRLRIG